MATKILIDYIPSQSKPYKKTLVVSDMNILLVNYRYFISGGPERYMFNVSRELAKHGHTILPFSIHYTNNLPTSYAKYFVGPLGSRDEVYFDDQKMTLQTLISTLKRLFYAKDVEYAVSHMIQETKPHIAYVLHYLRKLSPALLVGIKKYNIPIVVRLSDFGLLCPQTHCLRDNSPCTLCVEGKIFPSVMYRCVKGSYPSSFLNAIATLYHLHKRYFDLIDTFVVTNKFMYAMMIRAGYNQERLELIPTFTDPITFSPSQNFKKKDYVIFAGRIESIKGVHILIDAFAQLKRFHHEHPVKLKITGNGSKVYITWLKYKIATLGLENNIEFLGYVDSQQLSELLSQAIFSIVPSVCYENLPNAVLESFACGTPVLASDLGCLPDCVQDGVTGFIFRSGDSSDLAHKMELLLFDPSLAHTMAHNARNEALMCYTPARHIDRLIPLFERYIS